MHSIDPIASRTDGEADKEDLHGTDRSEERTVAAANGNSPDENSDRRSAAEAEEEVEALQRPTGPPPLQRQQPSWVEGREVAFERQEIR